MKTLYLPVVRTGKFFVLLLGFILATSAQAMTYGFTCITNTVAADCATGETQLAVEALDIGGGQVRFNFTNTGSNNSSIADVYFDDGSLLSIATIINDPGFVEFSQFATPQNLPGANLISPPFVTTTGFSADSNPPVQPMGVNPGEALGIIFDLDTGKTYANVLNDLGTGALRVGIHVQGYSDGGSESFVNIVPEPGSVFLIGLGLLGLATRRGYSRRPTRTHL